MMRFGKSIKYARLITNLGSIQNRCLGNMANPTSSMGFSQKEQTLFLGTTASTFPSSAELSLKFEWSDKPSNILASYLEGCVKLLPNNIKIRTLNCSAINDPLLSTIQKEVIRQLMHTTLRLFPGIISVTPFPWESENREDIRAFIQLRKDTLEELKGDFDFISFEDFMHEIRRARAEFKRIVDIVYPTVYPKNWEKNAELKEKYEDCLRNIIEGMPFMAKGEEPPRANNITPKEIDYENSIDVYSEVKRRRFLLENSPKKEKHEDAKNSVNSPKI